MRDQNKLKTNLFKGKSANHLLLVFLRFSFLKQKVLQYK